MKIKSFFVIFLILASYNASANLELNFSHSRGYYNNSFSLIIETTDPNATIKFTTNGKTPSINEGNVYNGAIAINTTSVVKAFAYSTTETSMVEAHTFIYLNEIINQPSITTGFPYSTGFSTTIKNDVTYGPMLQDALLSIPVMCLSLDLTDYNFIYTNKSIPKQAHVEYFEHFSNESYDRPAGVSTYGNSTFYGEDANKKNYRLRFKDEYGASKFKYKIFGDEAVNEFDVIDLRCGGQETIDRGGVQNIHEQLMKDWQTQTSGYGVHGKYVHLYINGVYWGVYTACERPAKAFGESYFGGDKDDYNTIKSACCDSLPAANDGTVASYNYMVSQTGNYPAIEQYLDVDHFIDWVMICNFGPHGDWTPWNTYAIDNPTANVPFRFFMWDPEPSFKNDWYYTDYPVETRFFKDIWEPLNANVDFRMRHADHTQCNCIEADGPINPNNATSYYDEKFQQYKLAYLAEAARWADKTLYEEFLAYRDDLINTNWFYDRSTLMINAYKTENIYPTIDAVTFSQYGGMLSNGQSISLSNPNGSGTIQYTTDRTDPRAPGGNNGANAQAYNNPIILPTGVHEIKARVKQNNIWSAMCPRKFYVGQNYNGLVINEIHYNPNDSIFFNPNINANDTVSGKNFEFIELKNTSTQNIYLEDLNFDKGVTLTFESNTIIPPNGFVVIAEDAFWFEQKYGFAPDAIYRGKLDNGGENLRLVDPQNNPIDSLQYDDNSPWTDVPDDGVFSLALIDATLDNNNPSNWSVQSVPVSPKAENLFCTPITANEFLIHVNCGGTATGAIIVNSSGGTPPFSYQWSNGMTASAITGLSAGTYQLTTSDAYSCETVNSFIINEPTVLQSNNSAVNVSCNGGTNGAIQLTASGGTAPYSYSWSNGSTSQNLNNVSAGNYSVNITDNNGCIETSSASVTQPSALLLNNTTINVLCNGNESGSIQLQANGGTSPYSYSWSNGSTSQNLSNLLAGNYSVNVVDDNGCLINESFSINEPTELNLNSTSTNVICNGNANGSIQIIPTGGTSPYTYSWQNGQTSQNLTNISGGTYLVNVTDDNNCSETISTTVNEPNQLTLSSFFINESIVGENDGVINLAVIGGTTPYTYVWSHGPNYQDVNNLAPGTYTVNVTDANNCIETLSVTIEPGQVVCSTPNNINAANIQNTSATISWSNDANANNYQVQYREVGTINWTSFNSNFAFAIMNNLTACSNYEVRILSNCSTGQATAYSNIYTFTTDGCISECAPIIGLFSQNVTTSSAFLVWDIVPNTTYTMYYRTIGNQTWFSYATSFPIAILFSLPACTDFEWYVEVNCTNGNVSIASPIKNFTTTGAACKLGSEQIVLKHELKIYPNPVKNILIINLPKFDSNFDLEVIDMQGKVLIKKSISKYELQYQLDVSKLSNGSYLIKVNSLAMPFIKQ